MSFRSSDPGWLRVAVCLADASARPLADPVAYKLPGHVLQSQAAGDRICSGVPGWPP